MRERGRRAGCMATMSTKTIQRGYGAAVVGPSGTVGSTSVNSDRACKIYTLPEGSVYDGKFHDNTHITNPDMDCIKLEIATFKFGE